MTSTSLEYIAANADEAIKKGLNELNVTREEVDIEILEQGSRGIFGIGARQARVRQGQHRGPGAGGQCVC